MAIARDTSVQATVGGNNAVSTSMTLGGSATLLIGCAIQRLAGDVVTGMTWNGVAMTFGFKIDSTANQGALNSWINVYYTLAPTTGNHTIAAASTANVGNDFDLYAVSYTGTSTSAFADNSTTNTGNSTTPQATLTPVATGAWGFLIVDCENSAVSASTGSTLIQNQHGSGIFDSNGIISGSTNMRTTITSGKWGAIMISIAPPAAAGGNSGFLSFMKV